MSEQQGSEARERPALPEEAQPLVRAIEEAFLAGHYDDAIRLAYQGLERPWDLQDRPQAAAFLCFTHWLIDAGAAGRRRGAVEDAQVRLSEGGENLSRWFTNVSNEYNLGNVYSALFQIDSYKPGFARRLSTVSDLLAAKNHYWRAYKGDINAPSGMRPQLLTNLANSLIESGRIAEALPFMNAALDLQADIAQTNLSRSNTLLKLWRSYGVVDPNLMFQAMRGFERAAQDPSYQRPWRANADAHASNLRKRLVTLGHPPERVAERLTAEQPDEQRLGPYGYFCVANGLALNAHSLYCSCAASRHDRLGLGLDPRKDRRHPLHDWLDRHYRRLTLEFAQARLLLYEGLRAEGGWDLQPDHTASFATPDDSREELVRSAFRSSFGILDKIAHGVGKLFKVAKESEQLTFESFWRPPSSPVRWDALCAQDNEGLLALFSIAHDLNWRSGEWGDLKEWRNLIEHRLLEIIEDSPDESTSTSPEVDCTVRRALFRERSIHLLQLVRSAIFAWVLCVRTATGALDYWRYEDLSS